MNTCVENVASEILTTPRLAEEAAHSLGESTIDLAVATNAANRTAPARHQASAESIRPQMRSVRARFPFLRIAGLNAEHAPRTPRIVHVRMDSFFASVEQTLSPELRGKPILLGRNVVASASHDAIRCGVKIGMSTSEALLLCPEALTVAPQYARYGEIAERIRRILKTYTPDVETAGLDDFYLDFANAKLTPETFEEMLLRMQTEIRESTGLAVSVGAACNRAMAAMASRTAGPSRLRVIAPGKEHDFLAPLSADRLQGLTRSQLNLLTAEGILTLGQLRLVPKPVLVTAFGESMGLQLWRQARGLDQPQTTKTSNPLTISRQALLENGSCDSQQLDGLLAYLSDRLCSALRDQQTAALAIDLSISYVDEYATHQCIRLTRPTSSPRDVRPIAKELFTKLSSRPVAVRQISLAATVPPSNPPEEESFVARLKRRWTLNREMALSAPCLSR
jgi:DNA polymerase-4